MNSGEIRPSRLRSLIRAVIPAVMRSPAQWLRAELVRAGHRDVTERQAYRIVATGKAPSRYRPTVVKILVDAHAEKSALLRELAHDLDALRAAEAAARAQFRADVAAAFGRPHDDDAALPPCSGRASDCGASLPS